MTDLEMITIFADIIEKNKVILDGFHNHVYHKCKHKDIGIEGWARIELVSTFQQRV